jgi:hypothetical protein
VAVKRHLSVVLGLGLGLAACGDPADEARAEADVASGSAAMIRPRGGDDLPPPDPVAYCAGLSVLVCDPNYCLVDHARCTAYVCSYLPCDPVKSR